MNTQKMIAAVVAASIASSSVLPATSAYAQDRYRGAYDGPRYHDDYRPYRYYRDYRDEARPRFKRRRYFDDRPGRYAKRKRHAPHYAQIRKRKKRNKAKKWIAIGAGILALGILANAASKHQKRH